MTLILLSPTATEKLEIHLADGVDILQYDATKVSRSDLERWAQLSESVSSDNFYLVPETPQLCVDNSPLYRKCGSRDLQDPNFYTNAKTNLSRIEHRISQLESAKYPLQLKPVIQYFATIQKTSLKAYLAEIQYLRDGNTSHLRVVIDGHDYGDSCNSVLNEVEASSTRTAAYKLVRKDWMNCVNVSFRKHLGPYPRTAWDSFLEEYSIQEEFKSNDPDD
jgi:hypothetical protein